MQNLTSLRWLHIHNNPSLKNLNGLTGLTAISSFSITGNDSLADISGLNNLRRAATFDYNYAFSYIGNNASLTSIDGLSNLESVEYYFEISGNTRLKNVDGLKSLIRVDEMYIFGNDSLQNLNGFSHLQSAGILQIYQNEQLTEYCGLYNLVKDLTIADTGRVAFYSNGYNPTFEQIVEEGPCTGNLSLVSFRYGGEVREGSRVNLTWEGNIAFVKLQYRFSLNNSEWITIADNIQGDDSVYSWVIPLVDSDDQIYLKISDADNPALYDTSTTWLTIRNVSLSFLTPAGDENYSSGESIPINWKTYRGKKFRIEYSLNNGVRWLPLAENVTETELNWIAPEVSADSVKLRVIEQDLEGVFAESNPFSISAECTDRSVMFTGGLTEGISIEGDSLNVQYRENISISTWVKLDSSGREMPVISKFPNFSHYFGLYAGTSNIRFGFSTGIINIDLYSEIRTSVSLEKGKWYHIAVTRTAGYFYHMMHLYLDGKLLDSASTYPNALTSSPDPIIIGNDYYPPWRVNGSMQGEISEVQIYDKTLTAAEVKTLYHSPGSIADSVSLGGYWKLNGNAEDYSGRGSHGRYMSSPIWACGNISGTTTAVSGAGIPDNYYLSRNYPNPFNPNTRIEFGLPEKSYVSMDIYDIRGSRVAVIINEEKPAGRYTVDWHPQNTASGIYFCRISAGKFNAVRKLVYLK